MKGGGPALRPFFPGALVEVGAPRGASRAAAGPKRPGGVRVTGGARSPGSGGWGSGQGAGPADRAFLAAHSSSLNPPGDPWSTAAMPREDRATWKSNYFMKIIVSAAGAPGGAGLGRVLRLLRDAGRARAPPGHDKRVGKRTERPELRGADGAPCAAATAG